MRSKRRLVERSGERLHISIVTALEAKQLAMVGTALVTEIRNIRPTEVIIDLTGVEALELAEVESIIDLMTIARVLSVDPSITGISRALAEQLHRDGTPLRHGGK